MTTDPVRLAITGTACGVASGTAVTAAALWLVRTLQVGAPAGGTPDLGSPAALVLLVGSLGGMLTAAVTAWRLLAPLDSTYRQGALSVVAGFATVLVVTVAGFPADALAGRWGLLGLALAAVLAAMGLGRAAARARPPA